MHYVTELNTDSSAYYTAFEQYGCSVVVRKDLTVLLQYIDFTSKVALDDPLHHTDQTSTPMLPVTPKLLSVEPQEKTSKTL